MKTRLGVTWLMLSVLLLAGCTAGQQKLTQPSPAVAPSTPESIQPGPGLWPTGMPAPPSPTVTPALAVGVSEAPSPGVGAPEALPPVIASSNTVATSAAPGWTTYESINDIRDLAFGPDGTLWAATSGGLVHWNLGTQTYARYAIRATAIDVAPDGSLWLVLQRGVCRFDAVSCDTYLTDHDTQAVAVAPNGIVWVGTGRGVSRFDGSSWRSYPSPVATHDLAVTDNGDVWAATAGGVGRYLPAEDRWITYTGDQGLPGSGAQVIAAGPGGEVWAYLVWQGVYRFDGTGWQKVEGAGLEVFDIAFAADGTPWVATAGGLHYPGGSLSYHDGNQWHDVASGQEFHSFTCATLGPGGIVAASTQLGVGLYEDGEWRLLRDGPTSGRVTSVAVTAGGAAWFGFGDHSASTPGLGLSRFDGQTWEYFLDDAEVGALAVGSDGTLWAGTGCSVQHFDGTAWEVVARCGELPPGNVLDIALAPDGAVWVANGMSLNHFDGESWTTYERLVHSLEVVADGTVWMNGWEGTQGSSYVARFAGGTWTTFRSADSFPGAFTVRAVTPDGRLWGMAPQGGLASFDGRSWEKGESWTFYDIPGRGSQDPIHDLAVAPDGALWLTADDAILRFDPESAPDEAWTVYAGDRGLRAGYQQAMAFGPDEIWLGATRFQPARAGADGDGSTAAP